uniref:Uncharacterized protein LOC114343590 n=2 Tax=Diabrotica virgifera virgifera TaxID=50390 RepID=A0A6P7GKQ4_DIAVI
MCSSHIVLKVNNTTNEASMTYFKTHYGHDLELKHIRIPENTRNIIASKLALGITANNIINPIRNSFGSHDLERTDLITKKDIYNIKKSFNLDVTDGVRHSDDAVSVSLWVKEMSGTYNSPVLYYKPQGSEDSQHNLDCSDFCIIIMNDIQRYAVMKFAQKFVCIDGTHGTNPYNFELTTLMVSDDFGEGIAVAYMISNRMDTTIYKIFFNCIKAALGKNITTDTFMSDITETFYNGWTAVMGPVPNRLFCSWHIDRAWRTNLGKISSLEKRKEVYKCLKFIQSTLKVDIFNRRFVEFLTQLENDSDTVKFYEYLTKNYSSNTKSWAYCYRKELLINTNMYLESMHRIIKYEYLEGKKVKQLDKNIHNLMRYTRDKQVERLIKITKGKRTDRLTAINSSHKVATNSKFDIESVEGSDEFKKWTIKNTTNTKTYTVTEKTINVCCMLSCQLCKICYHSYSCTCLDYFIKSNICQHIHYLCITQVTNEVPSTSTNSDIREELEYSFSIYVHIKNRGILQNYRTY